LTEESIDSVSRAEVNWTAHRWRRGGRAHPTGGSRRIGRHWTAIERGSCGGVRPYSKGRRIRSTHPRSGFVSRRRRRWRGWWRRRSEPWRRSQDVTAHGRLPLKPNIRDRITGAGLCCGGGGGRTGPSGIWVTPHDGSATRGTYLCTLGDCRSAMRTFHDGNRGPTTLPGIMFQLTGNRKPKCQLMRGISAGDYRTAWPIMGL